LECGGSAAAFSISAPRNSPTPAVRRNSVSATNPPLAVIQRSTATKDLSSISTSCQDQKSSRRVPHSAPLSGVGGFVEARPSNPPRTFGVRRLCRRLLDFRARHFDHAGGAPQPTQRLCFSFVFRFGFSCHPDRGPRFGPTRDPSSIASASSDKPTTLPKSSPVPAPTPTTYPTPPVPPAAT
jgi:hypothetical protein